MVCKHFFWRASRVLRRNLVLDIRQIPGLDEVTRIRHLRRQVNTMKAMMSTCDIANVQSLSLLGNWSKSEISRSYGPYTYFTALQELRALKYILLENALTDAKNLVDVELSCTRNPSYLNLISDSGSLANMSFPGMAEVLSKLKKLRSIKLGVSIDLKSIGCSLIEVLWCPIRFWEPSVPILPAMPRLKSLTIECCRSPTDAHVPSAPAVDLTLYPLLQNLTLQGKYAENVSRGFRGRSPALSRVRLRGPFVFGSPSLFETFASTLETLIVDESAFTDAFKAHFPRLRALHLGPRSRTGGLPGSTFPALSHLSVANDAWQTIFISGMLRRLVPMVSASLKVLYLRTACTDYEESIAADAVYALLYCTNLQYIMVDGRLKFAAEHVRLLGRCLTSLDLVVVAPFESRGPIIRSFPGLRSIRGGRIFTSRRFQAWDQPSCVCGAKDREGFWKVADPCGWLSMERPEAMSNCCPKIFGRFGYARHHITKPVANSGLKLRRSARLLQAALR
jgi:hypothetical protein